MPVAPLFVVALLPNVASTGSSYAGLVLTVSSIATTFGAIWLGWLGDKKGHQRILMVSAVVAMIFYIPQTFVSDISQLLILQGLAGVAAGGVLAAPAAMLANFTHLGDEGSVYGLDASVSSSAKRSGSTNWFGDCVFIWLTSNICSLCFLLSCYCDDHITVFDETKTVRFDGINSPGKWRLKDYFPFRILF